MGQAIDTDRWRVAYGPGEALGLEVRQNVGLEFVFPKGFYTALQYNNTTMLDQYGLNNNSVFEAVEHRTVLEGDFDVTIDYADFQGLGTAVSIALMASTQPV